MARLDPLVADHLEWLGFVQPTGLVVSATALVRAGAILDRRDTEGQRLLRECVDRESLGTGREESPTLCGFKDFAASVLGWSFSPNGYAGTLDAPIPPELEVHLPEYGETLKPDYAVRERDPVDSGSPWQLLVRIVPPEQDLDATERGRGRLEASAHGRMERLLRETGVPGGLLSNGRALRLISAPRGESSGWLDFKVADMVQTAGRPISTAMRLLLDEQRLLALPKEKRLAALLEDSRKYQNEVSEKLSAQVLHALYELLRGFQSAHDRSNGTLLRETLDSHPDSIYQALLTVIMRLVFLLYAEERDMLPKDETFLRYYSVVGLHERLREDTALYPDTMTQRFGAWAQVLSLFRIINDGTEDGPMGLPARRGVLFDPDRFPFLEGRSTSGHRPTARIEPPLVPDANVYRALEQLLVLDGERISYRALDVEQLGSVYETMMGFHLETASGRSVAIRSQGKWGAATAIDLESLLAEPAGKRSLWVQERADRKLSDQTARAVKAAESIDQLHAALAPVIDAAATPDILPEQAMVLQPSEERRRSGSHYTPRSLTEPIVRTTLEPILARLRGGTDLPPRPEQLLELKTCDPAMGSGAFLVEACRQLGDALVESWRAHLATPDVPTDEDEVVFARRLIAQRCLYGVDKNPMAVDLAKTSLWLVTLARDHSLTFLAHALRQGDSLVGLTRKQIQVFHWNTDAETEQTGFEALRVGAHLANATNGRERIRLAPDNVADEELGRLWGDVMAETGQLRLIGDLVLASFFEGTKPQQREMKRAAYAQAIVDGTAERFRAHILSLREASRPLAPFHWHIEFPEVFERDDPGFDAFVGNPPFLGGKLIAPTLGDNYNSYLKTSFESSKGAADLCAYFFRRTFELLRPGGSLGLIATNTISQADTREVGLDWIALNGGDIYRAVSRLTWPGQATVNVSVLHISKGPYEPRILDGVRVVTLIASDLTEGAQRVNPKPSRLAANFPLASGGTGLLGIGFVIDAQLYSDWVTRDPRLREVLRPYVNGRDVASMAGDDPERYVIDFANRSEEEAAGYPLAFERVVELVKPQRDKLTRQIHEECYWKHWDKRAELYRALSGLQRVLVCPFVSKHLPFTFLPSGWIYSKELVVIPTDDAADFAVLQSSAHGLWARHYSGTLRLDLSYSISDALRTFPMPEHGRQSLMEVGEALFAAREDIRRRSGEGLTKLYNRLNDPDDRSSAATRLRELHTEADRAVLVAYGWSDVSPNWEFIAEQVGVTPASPRKSTWRYRWPDDVSIEVLGRLRQLNGKRAEAEARLGVSRRSRNRTPTRHRPAVAEPKRGFFG